VSVRSQVPYADSRLLRSGRKSSRSGALRTRRLSGARRAADDREALEQLRNYIAGRALDSERALAVSIAKDTTGRQTRCPSRSGREIPQRAHSNDGNQGVSS